MYFLLRTEIRDMFFAQEGGRKGREGRRFRPGSAAACRDGTNDKCYVLSIFFTIFYMSERNSNYRPVLFEIVAKIKHHD